MHPIPLPRLNHSQRKKQQDIFSFLKVNLYLLLCWIPVFTGWSILFFFLCSCIHKKNRPNFTWPVEKPHTLSRKFSIYHEGIDFPKRIGHPVFSTAEGEVIYIGSQFAHYGKIIIIEHKHNWASLYAHLHKIIVRKGSYVKKGQKIGEVGNTGRSSGPHLHFELIYKKQPINPVRYLPR